MSFLQRPFSFGSLSLPNNIFYSPLAGCSDYPFRQMAAKYRPGLLFCEMVKMEALVRYDYHTFRLLDYDAGMHPIGAQLVGSNPKHAGKAAKIIEELGFDTVDLNCGCPVDKVTKDGSGSGLLRSPERIGEIVAEMAARVKIPVTLKIRSGWSEEALNAPLITEIAEAAGAVAIAVHGRTRAQAYRGPADWEIIRECKARAKGILVIGNGDLFDPESAEKMFSQTGCDAVLVSRGTMGNPSIIREILARLEGGREEGYSLERSKKELLEHYHLVLDYVSGQKAVVDARRIGCWHFKEAPGVRQFRHAISRVESPEEALSLIESYAPSEGPPLKAPLKEA